MRDSFSPGDNASLLGSLDGHLWPLLHVSDERSAPVTEDSGVSTSDGTTVIDSVGHFVAARQLKGA